MQKLVGAKRLHREVRCREELTGRQFRHHILESVPGMEKNPKEETCVSIQVSMMHTRELEARTNKPEGCPISACQFLHGLTRPVSVVMLKVVAGHLELFSEGRLFAAVVSRTDRP